MSKSLPLIALVVAVAALLAAFAFRAPEAPVGGNAFEATQFSVASTTVSNSVTTNERILASSSPYTRVYATICNHSSNPVYLLLDGDKAASASRATVAIASASGYDVCYEINDRNLYQGSVTASSTNQSATTLLISDYVL